MASKQTPLESKLRRKHQSSKKRFLLWGLLVLVVIVVAVIGGPLTKRAVVSIAMHSVPWDCKEIRVHAGVEISTDSILSLSGCETGRQLSEYSTTTISQRLEMHPWIQSASVIRHPPDILEIRIIERECIGIVRDTPDLGVSQDLYLLPCSGKPWVNKLPWLSVNAQYARQAGPLSPNDPLLPVATELARVRQISLSLAGNIAELYRVDGNWGTVLMNPVLSVTIAPGISSENWLALDQLLSDAQFQDRLDSNAVVDLRLPGFVTLQVPPPRAEETKSS